MIISRNELVIRELEMTEHYLDRLARTINENWDSPALTEFYLTEDGNSQDTSRGNHYTYGEMYEEIVRVANLLINLGLQKGDHVVICGANSAHWIIAYLAIAKMQGVSVTVMHSLQPDQIAQMINFSDAEALFVDKEIWDELKEHSFLQVKSVINLDDWSILYGEKQSINHKSSIINEECGFPHSEPDSLAMICFTSGSSGNPKGVMLSYRNISYTIAYQVEYLSRFAGKNTISLLPLGHIYGCIDEFVRNVYLGTHINILKNISSTEQIVNCYKIIQPCYVALVPFLLKYFIQSFSNNVQRPITDFFGEKIEKVFVAAAELPQNIEEKLLLVGLPLLKGYGATECSPSIANSITCEQKTGSVGKAVSATQISIASNGEILVKGENVMLGYYKDPEATAAKIDKDGWLHTGDKGYLDEDGYLYVEGRLEQDIIVLPNGENIRPDNIESLINALPEVSESIVFARDGKLVARVVVPSSLPFREESEVGSLRHMILRQVNPQLPLFSQLYDVEITDQPLARTEKQTLKRYLYK